MSKRKVLAYAQRLDKIAEEVEKNYSAYGLSEREAAAFVHQIDTLSDRMMESHGINPRYLEQIKDALVVERDADEPHLDTFHSPADDVKEHDADEEALKHMDQQHDSFHRPLEDGFGQPGLIHADKGEDMDKEEEKHDDDKEASLLDWWDEDPREASTDYWEAPTQRKTDYWD